MKMLNAIAAACLGLLATIAPAHATLIDFSSYKEGAVFSQPLTILGATFASSTDTLKIVNFGAGNSLCAFDGVGCSGTLAIGFNPGVADLGFTYSGDDQAGSQIDFQGEGSTVSFVGRLYGDGDPATTGGSQLYFEDVSFLVISSNDPGGIGLTSVNYAGAAAVPEPATWAMMILGFGVAGVAMRRRQGAPTLRPQAI